MATTGAKERWPEPTITLSVGQAVICGGYPGTVTEVHTGQLAGMVTVRLYRGSICTSITEIVDEALRRDARTIKPPIIITPAARDADREMGKIGRAHV